MTQLWISLKVLKVYKQGLGQKAVEAVGLKRDQYQDNTSTALETLKGFKKYFKMFDWLRGTQSPFSLHL